MDLTKITYLIVFPDGEVWYGYKKDEYVSHPDILKTMQETNQEFMELTKYYDLEDQKNQIKMYEQLVSADAIVYHAWSTCAKEPTSDADIYLPSTIYKSQIELFESIKEQFDSNKLLILNKMVEENSYTELRQLSYKTDEMNVNKLMEYLEEHLAKQK